nr:hypothetical protein B0A51_14681 [Rachicladosporium sp. CCFEE 5018]
MRAITVFGVLFAATTARASSYETDDSDGLKKQCFLSTDFAHKADPGLKSISPPYRDDYIDTPTVVASWPGDVQHNTAMTRVHLPSEYTKLVEVEFIITDFAGSTFDPALLIDDVRHCNQLSSCVSLARARFTVQRMEMEIAHEWIHEMFDRRDKFFAHEHQHGQQHGGMEDKHSGGHGTEEL